MNEKPAITSVARISDAEAASLVSDAAFGDLAERIVAQPTRRRRTLPTITILAAAAVLALVMVVSFNRPATGGGALAFTTSQGYIDVVIRDPYASPDLYRAELAAHHLNISLWLVPGSPSTVGTLVMGGGNGIALIRDPHACTELGGGACVIGVRIPEGFRGSAQIVFARQARPGERYETSGSVTAPGEAMHGLDFRHHTVAWLLSVLAQRHVHVFAFTVYQPDGSTRRQGSVPGDLYVIDATGWAPGQVLVLVSRTQVPPSRTSCAPVDGQPCPSTSPPPAATH